MELEEISKWRCPAFEAKTNVKIISIASSIGGIIGFGEIFDIRVHHVQQHFEIQL